MSRRHRITFAIGTLFSCGITQAEDWPVPPELPPTTLASTWIDQHPDVVQARHAAAASGHAAAAIEAGPHEWIARVGTQRRNVRDVGNSTEWTAQIERGIRIGGKAGLDRQLAEQERELAQARIGEARHEAARELATVWLDALVAEEALVLAKEQLVFAEASAQAVARRKRAGDASMLDLNAADVDLAEAQRQASVAEAQLARSRTKLRLHYPQAKVARIPLSEPKEPMWIEAQWRDKVLAESDPLKIALGLQRKATLAADRARADRLADPVVGVYTANEAFHNERVVGLSVTLPFGGARTDKMRQALSEAEAAGVAYERERREAESEVTEAFAEAVGGTQRWRIAERAATSARETARLMQRAYSLGEADLHALLQARRQSVEASSAALQSRAEALRVQHRLLVDAHLIWDLEHD
jgi:outer membrane protein, heavy metal efflux system